MAVVREFGRLLGGKVVEVIVERGDITKEWPADFLAKFCVEITDVDPKPQIGWDYSSETFTAPSPAPLAYQMANAVAQGCAVVSTATPSLDATYDAAGLRWQQMLNEALYTTVNGSFSAGLSELDWPAISGEVVFATTDQFKAVVKAIGDWLTLWQRYVDGKSQSAPTLPVTIA